MEALIILFAALAIDLILGEPPAAIHPVVWMGKVISFLIKGGVNRSSKAQFFYGLVVVLLTIGIFAVPAYFALSYLRDINQVAYILLGALVLKTSFSLKELRRSALKIKRLLIEDKLSQARFELRVLVGRDTSKLDRSQMVSATVESVAENTCDSFVAPLFYFLFFGVPGAVAYRAVNTLDAMIGHHGEFEHLGKFAARLDTVANFIPARITALAMVLATWLNRKNTSAAWHIMLRDRSQTESPNAGWTMSAVAGSLGIQVEKVGYYKLGDGHHPRLPDTIDASLKIVVTASLIWYLIVMLTTGVRYYVAV